MRCTWASRRAVFCSKKPHRLQRKQRLKICFRSIVILLLLLLLSGDIETNPGPMTGTLMHEGKKWTSTEVHNCHMLVIIPPNTHTFVCWSTVERGHSLKYSCSLNHWLLVQCEVLHMVALHLQLIWLSRRMAASLVMYCGKSAAPVLILRYSASKYLAP